MNLATSSSYPFMRPETPNTSQNLQCREFKKASACDYLNFASLHKCFQSMNILDFDPEGSGANDLSPKELLDNIKEAPFHPYYHVGRKHVGCCPKENLVEKLRLELKKIDGLSLDEFGKKDVVGSDPSWSDVLGKPAEVGTATGAHY